MSAGIGFVSATARGLLKSESALSTLKTTARGVGGDAGPGQPHALLPASVRRAILGALTLAAVFAALPDLWRHLCGAPRKRKRRSPAAIPAKPRGP